MTCQKRPTSGDAPFEQTELFFSRTDTRGVILAANQVFQRVSDYPWDTLIGAPHKLIRHPDMPRGVFWLLWQSLNAGRPIGAYVKNLARDGLHYWVFATISPIDGGFLSTRIKPSDKILPVIEAEYANLRALEADNGLTPEASGNLLLGRLAERGFPSYSSFMSHAICTELHEVNAALDVPAPPQMRPFLNAMETVASLKGHATTLYNNLRALRCTPVNMRLTASRIEGSSGPVGLMAHNYATVLREVEDWLFGFLDPDAGDLAKISGATQQAAFDFASGHIQLLARTQFAREATPEHLDEITSEMDILDRQADCLAKRATQSLGVVQHRARALDWAIRDMRRGCAGLNATRMMCKAEAARLNGAGGLGAIVEMLDLVQVDTETQASAILDASVRLLSQIEKIQASAAAHHLDTKIAC